MRIFRSRIDPVNAYALNYTAQTPSYGSVDLRTGLSCLIISREMV